MLSVSNISKSYGPITLFSNVSFSILKGDRVALVGANGVGKSTLFNIVLGQEEADGGVVSLNRGTTLGFLPQEPPSVGNQAILSLAVGITSEHTKLRQAMLDLETAGQRDSAEYSSLGSRYKQLGGYELEPQAQKILKGLAFQEEDFRRPASEMSGGWVMRAYIARLLVMAPDLLILDEPTNHLDLETLLWFQNYLLDYPGAIFLISHDRSFLNTVLGQEKKGRLLEIRRKQLHSYRGNYDDYCLQRTARLEQQWAAYRNQQEQIALLQRFVDRFGSKATKATQAQSKLKQIERMDKLEPPESDDAKIHIQFPQPESSGQRVITLSDVHHSYGALEVYREVNLGIERGERIVFIGPNGAGKSTLLKLLAGVLPIQQGERTLGLRASVGYYSQNRIDMLTPEHTVLEEAMDIPYPPLEESVRTILGSFLFRGDDVFKKVSVLSGGEKSRLSLVKLLLNPPNLLLMDEPTIHLDMDSCEVLMSALEQYQGTLVFISHDVTFIRRLAKKVLHIHSGRLTPYSGGYDYYLRKSQAPDERDGLVMGQSLTNAQPTNLELRNEEASRLSARELKRLEIEKKRALSNLRRELRMQVNRLEREISRLEAHQIDLIAQLEEPSLYEDREAVEELNQQLISAQRECTTLNQEWEKAATELSELEEQ